MKQKKLLDVMPECYVDTNLIEYLLDAGVNHQDSTDPPLDFDETPGEVSVSHNSCSGD